MEDKGNRSGQLQDADAEFLPSSGKTTEVEGVMNNGEECAEDNIEEDEEDEMELEDEEEEEEGYRLRFEGEMNPLDFTEDDAFGIQPYQQFERLEYEALAQKKRKLLAPSQGEGPFKKSRQEEFSGPGFDELMELMNYGVRKKSRKLKKRGRRRGKRNKVNPEVTQKLGDATLHYSNGRYEEAIMILKEVVRLAPNFPDPYHTLGLIYKEIGDTKKALNFYMIAAHFTPKDSSLWKLLVTWSIEQGNIGQARYCLSKAITADPEDITLRFHRASLYIELGDYQKAAESYDQISRLYPENTEAITKAAMLHRRCGQSENAIAILEKYLEDHPNGVDFSLVDLLAATCMQDNAYNRALQYIEHAKQVYCSGKDLPLYLTVRAGICHIHLGNIDKAELCFSGLNRVNAYDHDDLILKVGDAFMSLEHHGYALKYYKMLERNAEISSDIGIFYLRIAKCHLGLKENEQSIQFFYKALQIHEGDIEARLTLASLLLSEHKEDEAILLLSPPSESISDLNSDKREQWWLNSKVKLKLCDIYRVKGMTEAFVDTIFSSIHESLLLESSQQKYKAKKRLSTNVLFERIKVLNDPHADNVFHGFRPIATPSELSKASRAKKLLQKKATRKEEKRAAALAAGIDWISDDSDDDSPQQTLKEPPLSNLLKDEDHYLLITDLCKGLSSLKRYWEALEIINLTLKSGYNMLSVEKKEELRALGAEASYNITDPKHGFDCVRYIVQQHPYSLAAWNRYYKVILRLENRYSKHYKFLHNMRVKHKDSVPPILIFGHQLTMISQHQAAAREYLESYKLMPESPLINLCVGTALINLALGLRLQNKQQCVVQGLAFLYNNLRLCENSQEALYNIARAYHHVGLVSLAASYYEKVLATHQNDYPIPRDINDNESPLENHKSGYCDLRREAAHNLHLIYRESGALDLARQILKDHCTL